MAPSPAFVPKMETSNTTPADVNPLRSKRIVWRLFDTLRIQWATYRSVLGVMLINFTLGIPYYYGNMSSYSSSFFRHAFGKHHTDIGDEWMIPFYLIPYSVGALVTQMVKDRLGLRQGMFVFCFLFTTCLLLTYFSVKISVYLTIVSLMIVPGMCAGTILSLGYVYVKGWCVEKDLGTGLALATCAYVSGAIVYNPMTTMFINPDKVSPDLKEGKMMYFTQASVLERFPLVFFPIAGLTLLLQFTGLVCLQEPPTETDIEHSIPQTDTVTLEMETVNNNVQMEKSIACNTLPSKSTQPDLHSNGTVLSLSPEDGKKISPNYTTETFSNDVPSTLQGTNQHESHVIKTDCALKGYKTFETGNNDLSSKTDFKDTNELNGNMTRTLQIREGTKSATVVMEANPHSNDTTPKQLFRCYSFYAVFFSIFSLAYCLLIVSTFFKKYGELFVRDDRLLMSIMPASGIGMAVIRLLFGIFAHRLGVKCVIVASLSVTSVLMSFWTLSIHAGVGAYVVSTSTIMSFTSLLYFLMPASAIAMYGHAHFCTNYAMLECAVTAACIFSPLVYGYLLVATPWHFLALLGSFLTAVALFFALAIKP